MNPDEISRICADDTVRTGTEDQPPEELIGTVLDLAEARRRRTRWRFLASAAAVVVIAGGLFGGLASIGTSTQVVKVPVADGPVNWETVQATSKISQATASVSYAHQQWGEAFKVLADRIPIGTTCQLWVVHPDGTRTQVASWTTARDEGTVWYEGSMASTAGTISSFQITANHQVLLTATPT